MSTIIRVKRPFDEIPQEAIVLNCKKCKLENDDDSDKLNATVLQFAGTVENQEENIFQHCKSSLKDLWETQVKSKTRAKSSFKSVRDRIRGEFFQQMKENRYKVVNLSRCNNPDEESAKKVTVVDVEGPASCTSAQGSCVEQSASKPEFVYDLYYTSSDELEDMGDLYDDQLVGFVKQVRTKGKAGKKRNIFLITSRVYPLSSELMYGSCRDNGYVDSDGNQSEDSNDENHWRNDYPDEDEVHDDDSIQESDMLKAVDQMNLSDDLSSDEEVEGFVYSVDSAADQYGERYARFKAKFEKNGSDSSLESNASLYEDAEEQELDNSSTYYD